MDRNADIITFISRKIKRIRNKVKYQNDSKIIFLFPVKNADVSRNLLLCHVIDILFRIFLR